MEKCTKWNTAGLSLSTHNVADINQFADDVKLMKFAKILDDSQELRGDIEKFYEWSKT